MNKSFFLFANYCQIRQWCLLLRWTNASFCKRTFFSDVYNFARLSLDSNINASGWSIKIKRNEYPSENVIWKDLAHFSKSDVFLFFYFLFLFVLFIIYFWFVCNKICLFPWTASALGAWRKGREIWQIVWGMCLPPPPWKTPLAQSLRTWKMAICMCQVILCWTFFTS